MPEMSWDDCIAEEKQIVRDQQVRDLRTKIQRLVTGEVFEMIEELIEVMTEDEDAE